MLSAKAAIVSIIDLTKGWKTAHSLQQMLTDASSSTNSDPQFLINTKPGKLGKVMEVYSFTCAI